MAPNRFEIPVMADASGRILASRLVVLMLLLLSGCGTEQPPAPAPQSHSQTELVQTTSEEATTPSHEQPEVHEPLFPMTSSEAVEDDPPKEVAPRKKPTRPADDRPIHDDAQLAEIGILRYDSNRLTLYTDIEPDIARTLPPLIDAAYDDWVDNLGELPVAVDGSPFRITGYLIKNRDLFVQAKLLPEDLIQFEHGQHRKYRFWMWDQPYDYYRRHLLIHESTHCFMLIQQVSTHPPLWYLEGMAEHFGCHRIETDGTVSFRVMPDNHERFVGFGRIEMIREEIKEGRALSIDDVHLLSPEDFAESRSIPYAWSWALCKFLDTHPRYRERYHELAPLVDGGDFRATLHELFHADLPVLNAEWEVFVRTLAYGYDIEHAAIPFARGEHLPAGGSISVSVAADRGWQNTGILIQPGQIYKLTASGMVTLANQPKPWQSEPTGISIRYAEGRPIGRLLAGIQSEGTPTPEGIGRLYTPIDIGKETTLNISTAGTLYLRVNDFWGELADNTSEYRVTIEVLPQ